MKHCGKCTEAVVFLFALLFFLPVLFLTAGSVMGEDELLGCLGPILGQGDGYAEMALLPSFPTARSYVKVLLDTPEFFVMFWNSVKITAGILAGQIIFGTTAAWGLAKGSFPGRKQMLWIYIALMLMPFQVLMLPDYLVLKGLGLLDSHWGLIWQGTFSAFPVFLMYRFFDGIPPEMIEAAELDGAGSFRIFWHIGLPLGRAGIFSAMVQGLLESWSMIEQPMTFLKTKSLWPLSILLPEIQKGTIGYAFALSVLIFLPALLVFLTGQKYLEQGIEASSVKEGGK